MPGFSSGPGNGRNRGWFDDFYGPDAAEEYRRRSIGEVHSGGLRPMIKVTRMLRITGSR